MRKLLPLVLLLLIGWKPIGPWHGTIHDLALDPSNPDRLYAATHGGGVWRSTDGAKTWQLAGTMLADWVVRWVAVHPTTGAVYAGVEGEPHGGVARSTDGGATWAWIDFPHELALRPGRIAFVPGKPKSIWQADVNLHFRSDDGGATWKEFRVPDGDVHAFFFDPANAKNVWAAGTDGKTGLRRSSDGGATWTSAGKGLPELTTVRSIFIDPADAKRMVLRTTRTAFSSSDGGETWTPFGDDFPATDVHSVAVAPSQPRTIYGGGRDGLFRSDDGGATWEDIDYGLPRYIAFTIAVHPKTPQTVWVGLGGGGVWRTDDGGKSWTAASEGLAVSWIERVWGDASGTVYAQASTGLYRRDASSSSWTELRKPFSGSDDVDVDAIVFDPRNPRVVHAGDTSSYYRSTDGGKTWLEPAKPFQEPRPIFRSLVVDADGRTMYSADSYADTPAEAVFKSTDGGVKWKAAANGLTSRAVLALRGAGTGRLYALTKEHGLWRSTDGAATWRAAGTGLPAKLVDAAVDPAEPNRVVVVSEDTLFRSEDGGETWTASLKGKTFRAVVIGAGGAFAATDEGVYRSKDHGATWVAFQDGLTNVDVRALSAAGSRLYAGTAGGGVFVAEVE